MSATEPRRCRSAGCTGVLVPSTSDCSARWIYGVDHRCTAVTDESNAHWHARITQFNEQTERMFDGLQEMFEMRRRLNETLRRYLETAWRTQELEEKERLRRAQEETGP